jgi:hypothetical protein
MSTKLLLASDQCVRDFLLASDQCVRDFCDSLGLKMITSVQITIEAREPVRLKIECMPDKEKTGAFLKELQQFVLTKEEK